MLETIIILVLISIIVRSTFITSGVYKIRRGWNFSGIWFMKMFFSKRKPFYVKVVIDRSFMVKTLGVQKIFGIGDLLHHKNSDRYGFIYEGNINGKDIFGIYSYQYRNGQLTPWKKLGEVEPNQPFYICFYHDITEQYEMGRYLFPYFEQDGDDEKGAPHEMIIRLDFSKKIDQSLLKFSLKQI
jgi:hypothetical protein